MRSEELLSALSYLNLAVAAGTGVLVVLLLIQRQQLLLKLLIGAFYVLADYCLVISWMARAGLLASVPFLLYTNYVACIALGPIIYVYTERILGRFVRPLSILLMFLPALLMLVVVAAYHIGFPQSASAALGRRAPFPSLGEPVMYAACAAAELSFGVYFFIAGLRVQAAARDCRRARAKSLHRFSYLYLIGATTYLAVFAGHLLDNRTATVITATVNGFSILAYFLYIHNNPGITLRLSRKADTARLPGKPSAESNPADVEARLERLMSESKVYRKSDLTLPALGAMLGVSPNQLSLVLNDSLGVSFRTYINSRRLEEAKGMLIREGSASILDIAFSVGFNSKTTFNTLFMQDTGMSPKEYRSRFGDCLE